MLVEYSIALLPEKAVVLLLGDLTVLEEAVDIYRADAVHRQVLHEYLYLLEPFLRVNAIVVLVIIHILNDLGNLDVLVHLLELD